MLLTYVAAWAPYFATLGRGAFVAGREIAVGLCRRIV
jgi:hypothetical protein